MTCSQERIDHLTPERIYKLLEKQQQAVQNTGDRSSTKANRFQKSWQKIANYKPFKKLVKISVVATGIVLYFSLISYSAIEYQLIESNVQQKKENVSN